MALVRTDEGVVQMSGHAMVHMAGAVVALVFLPLGIGFVLRYSARPWWVRGSERPSARKRCSINRQGEAFMCLSRRLRSLIRSRQQKLASD